jgi:hypothetical protein
MLWTLALFIGFALAPGPRPLYHAARSYHATRYAAPPPQMNYTRRDMLTDIAAFTAGGLLAEGTLSVTRHLHQESERKSMESALRILE